MRSMTGFGQARGENPDHAVAVSLKAVNARFLDLNLRLREEYRASEAALRELFTGELYRGRVEVNLEIRPLGPQPVEVAVNAEVVRAFYQAGRELIDAGWLCGSLSPGDLLRMPEAFTVQALATAWDEAGQSLLLEVAAAALAELVAARDVEGEKLAAALDERLLGLTALAVELRGLQPTALEEAAAGLERRLGELLAEHVDAARLAQEAAVLADRTDVSEELDRLDAHLEHFHEVMAEPGAIGKRLDFLTQEIFRELNTLGAKCRNSAITRRVLDAKVLAEQIREQVQNVE